MKEARIYVSVQDIEHVKLHVWELERLIEDMKAESSPFAERLSRLLHRFTKTDPNEDRY